MSDQIQTHQVQRFKEGLRILAQQMGSRFREGVDVDAGAGGIKMFYDQIGKTAMVEITNRHGDTQLVETPHRRRMVTPRAYEVADLVDHVDLERITNDPTSTYSQVFASAARRTFDDRVIAAFFAAAATGEDGTTSTSFPTSTHSIASGSVGMTIDKWANARQILEAFENEEDGEQYKWSIAFQAQQRRNLLNTTEITDVDFNSVKALVRGQIDQFLGFTCVKSERLEKVSSDRYIPAWCRMSMKLAIWHDVEVSIKERVDKRESLQVRAWIQTGATRMDEDGVVRILCQEA